MKSAEELDEAFRVAEEWAAKHYQNGQERAAAAYAYVKGYLDVQSV